MQKVLIIDDDKKNIFALEATLRAGGWHVVTANSAPDGINMLNDRDHIGVVLMDMMLPGMDGYEAISVIRSKEDTRDIPIVAVTAQAMSGDREKCLAAGANDYVSKPVNVDRLFSILDRYLK